ncbi:MAG: helix-turn-helix domain-containing protein [Coriobacteriia bacterium]|nr:helix-turn-helix domain-containing protein [Coriobacteriia bacterium]
MKINNPEELGKAIRLRRKELGYTQTELADYSGCSLTFVSSLERGKMTAELGKAMMVINTLGVDLLFEQRGQYRVARSSSGLT